MSAWIGIRAPLGAVALIAAAAAYPPATGESASMASGSVPPASAPLVIRTSGDSVLVRFGDFQQWIRLTEVPSPDTTYLDPNHDLILVSRGDSTFIARSAGSATVQFVRMADTLSMVFHFQTRSTRDLARFRSVLRRYVRFGRTPPEPSIPFADAGRDGGAEELRGLFPLDGIAGSGSDLIRMRNLLHWIHREIRWDGSKENPPASTLGERMDLCIRQGLTMNCGGLAESYAAICRAVGLPARRIVCLPFDRNDPDCHSVTIVYSDSLQRWLYMDPTFEAWWTDAQGNLLGLEQARALLAAGDTVHVNPEANTNGTPRDPTEHLAYMSKNLFRFKTWLDPRTTLELYPCGYDSSAVGSVQISQDGKSRCYITDNSAVFWAQPEARRR
jgi:hypothetical protein